MNLPIDTGADSAAANADMIRILERRRLRALVDAEMEVADQLHAANFQLINPSGGAVSKAQYLGAISSGDIDYLVWEPESEIAVQLYDKVAVIRYHAHIEIIVFGTHSTLRAWHTDLYEKIDGRWQVVWSQATQIQN